MYINPRDLAKAIIEVGIILAIVLGVALLVGSGCAKRDPPETGVGPALEVGVDTPCLSGRGVLVVASDGDVGIMCEKEETPGP